MFNQYIISQILQRLNKQNIEKLTENIRQIVTTQSGNHFTSREIMLKTKILVHSFDNSFKQYEYNQIPAECFSAYWSISFSHFAATFKSCKYTFCYGEYSLVQSGVELNAVFDRFSGRGGNSIFCDPRQLWVKLVPFPRAAHRGVMWHEIQSCLNKKIWATCCTFCTNSKTLRLKYSVVRINNMVALNCLWSP